MKKFLYVAASLLIMISCEQASVEPKQPEFKLEKAKVASIECGMIFELNSGGKIYDETLPASGELRAGMRVEVQYVLAATSGYEISENSSRGCGDGSHSESTANYTASSCHSKNGVLLAEITTITPDNF